jgi:hypothetical protein
LIAETDRWFLISDTEKVGDQDTYNAHLIAAAPDLHRELRELFTRAMKLRMLNLQEEQRIANILAKAVGTC